MKTKTIFLTICSSLLFTAIAHAQCTSSSINAAELTAGEKVILTEISKEDDPEIHKAMIGKTLTVGTGGMANIGDCWFLGELNINGEDVFFVGVRLDDVKGESYGGTTPVVRTETPTASDFPVGAEVSVVGFQELDKSCAQFYSERTENATGVVIEADLVKDDNGNYSGCILYGQSLKHCFKSASVYKGVYKKE